MWMEEQHGRRINQMRCEQAARTNADIIASACPFCIQMFEDGITALELEASIKALDLAEIVADAID